MKQLTIRIPEHIHERMHTVKDQRGTPISKQIEFAVEEWHDNLEEQGQVNFKVEEI